MLHKVVLDMSQMSLQSFLDVSSEMLDQGDSHGRTALSWAAQRGDVDKLRLLIDHGASIDASDRMGQTPLHHAVQRRGPEVIRHLLLTGANLNYRDSTGNTPLHVMAAFQKDTDVIELVHSFGADFEIRNAEDATPLLIAAKFDNTPIFSSLLKLSELDSRNNLGYTPLFYGIMNNNRSIMTSLLKAGARYIVKGVQNDTILHVAAKYGEIKTIDLLRKANLWGLDENIKDTSGKTAMDIADERLDVSREWFNAYSLLIESLWKRSSRFEEVCESDEESDGAEGFFDALETMEQDNHSGPSSSQQKEDGQVSTISSEDMHRLQKQGRFLQSENGNILPEGMRKRQAYRRPSVMDDDNQSSKFASIGQVLEN